MLSAEKFVQRTVLIMNGLWKPGMPKTAPGIELDFLTPLDLWNFLTHHSSLEYSISKLIFGICPLSKRLHTYNLDLGGFN